MKLRKLKTKGSFKSPLENSVFRILNKLLPKRAKLTYESVRLNYSIPRNYVPDFVIERKNHKTMYIEVKGYFRQPDRVKILSVLRDNPGIDLRIVFEKNNKLNRKAKMRYSDWCEKYNILYSINSIPMDWLK